MSGTFCLILRKEQGPNWITLGCNEVSVFCLSSTDVWQLNKISNYPNFCKACIAFIFPFMTTNLALTFTQNNYKVVQNNYKLMHNNNKKMQQYRRCRQGRKLLRRQKQNPSSRTQNSTFSGIVSSIQSSLCTDLLSKYNQAFIKFHSSALSSCCEIPPNCPFFRSEQLLLKSSVHVPATWWHKKTTK